MKSITPDDYMSLMLNFNEHLFNYGTFERIAKAVSRKKPKEEDFFSIWFGGDYMLNCSYKKIKDRKVYETILTIYGNASDETALDMRLCESYITLPPEMIGITSDGINENDVDSETLCATIHKLLDDNNIPIEYNDGYDMCDDEDDYIRYIESMAPRKTYLS